MSTTSALSAAALSLAAVTAVGQEIRPFRVNVSDADLSDLRRRVQATRWPDKDPSQGTQLAKLQELVRYWGTGYDWRKIEAKLNSYPQYLTNIDGVDIRAYPTLTYFHEVDKGGHFAAWEQPELFASELRAAFRQVRGAQ